MDRDGVLNRDRAQFVRCVADLEVLPGAVDAVARLNRAGYIVIVATNQSGIGRGLMAEEALEEIHGELRRAMREGGATLSGIYHCPHVPGSNCDCRKPAPGLLLRAARAHDIDLERSFLVGDQPHDIAAGAAVGCRTVLVLTGKTPANHGSLLPAAPDFVARDVGAAADWILEAARVDANA